jgi:hypothetical protein
MGQLFSSADGSQRNLRVALFVIILATLPFYCLGFILWGAAPAVPSAIRTTVTATLPPNTSRPTLAPSATSDNRPFITATSISPLQPTPIQFFPPGGGVNPLPPTAFLPPTQPPVVIPSPTTAPTLTPLPSATAIPVATSTTIPIFPTDTPSPTDGAEQAAVNGESDLPPLDANAPSPTQESV